MKTQDIKYKKWLSNKYFLATVVFVLLLLFSDRNSVFDQYRFNKQYNKAAVENEYFKDRISSINTEYNELFGSSKSLEKFGREKYLMKRDNEDVYVIVKTPPKP